MPSSVVLTRAAYGAHIIVERKVQYAQIYENRLEKGGGLVDRKEFAGSTAWWWRARDAQARAYDLYNLGEPAPFLAGWAAPATGLSESVTAPGDADAEANLVRVARWFDVWQRKPSLVATLGTPLPIDDAMLQLFGGIASSGSFGRDVPWGKGHLAVVPRSLDDDILRCDVTASVDHQHLERPAHHELKGTLDLWTPTGWPKRFVADGAWRLHDFVLAGRTVIDGTFHVEFHWSYGTDVRPVAPPPPKP